MSRIATWLQDVTNTPPTVEELTEFFYEKLDVRTHWWNKKERNALRVVAAALLEMGEMVVREAKITDRLKEIAHELTIAKKGAMAHALDAQTTAVVLRHRLAVSEEVASALSASIVDGSKGMVVYANDGRLEKALAAYRVLEQKLS